MSLVIVAIAAAVFCVLGLVLPAGKRHDTPAQRVQPVFARIYSALSPPPELKVSSSYGFPSFEIAFSSKTEFSRASALNDEFKRELHTLFGSYGSIDRPFDPDLATFFNYPGRIQELLAASVPGVSYVKARENVV